jgi:hypothetical protein
MLGGAICGYGVGVAVPGVPGDGDNGPGVLSVGCSVSAWAAHTESIARVIAVRMSRFIDGLRRL